MLATVDWQLLVGTRPSSLMADAARPQLHLVAHTCGGTNQELDRICTGLETSICRLGVRNQVPAVEVVD
jgi:hypothetical protein